MATAVDERTLRLQAESTQAIGRTRAEPRADLAAERGKATFAVEALTEFLYGGATAVRRRHDLVGLLKQDEAFSKEDYYFLTREQHYTRGLRCYTSLMKLVVKNGVTREEIGFVTAMMNHSTPMDLHMSMFIPTVFGQGTPDQVAEWGPKALRHKVLGTYAQTELGHGTFLRGLETTATLDEASDEIILHSPFVSSMKWWPGGLGKTSNHAVVMARLFHKGADLGPQPFLLQLRDEKTHEPLPGIELGDIGPKLGFNIVDNGFMRLHHVRIPRTSMLMKNASLAPDGAFQRGAVAKANYGTMVFVRAIIVAGSFYSIAKAVTIAIRYNAVRRQTLSEGQTMETQVLDYKSQQDVLFPLLAFAYATHFTRGMMLELYNRFAGKGEGTFDFSVLPELHAVSSGLKALCTTVTADSVELCRKACGGHGFSDFSGLPTLYRDWVAACTYEGENNVMHLQTARYLVKQFRSPDAGGKLTGYLSRPPTARWEARGVQDVCNHAMLLAAFEHRSAHLVDAATEDMSKLEAQGMTEGQAREACNIQLIRAAKAHSYLVILRTFVDAVAAMTDARLRAVVGTLCSLFGAWYMQDQLGDFMEDGFVSQTQASLVRKAVLQLLAAVRPNAVALVDAFDFDDYFLNSAIGRKDGDVYQALYDMAKRAPLNKTEVGPGYKESIRPLLLSKL